MPGYPPDPVPPDPVPPDPVPPDPVPPDPVPPDPPPRWRRLLATAAGILLVVAESLTGILLAVAESLIRVLRPRRTDPPPRPRHPEETITAMATARRYEQLGRQDFEARVAEESGTHGWENLCIFVIALGGVSSAILVHRAGYFSQSIYLYAFSGACALWVLIRWRIRKRRNRTPR